MADRLSEAAALYGVAYKNWVLDAQKGYPITKSGIKLLVHFGDWGQMCIDVLTALMEGWGYIIP